MILMMILMIRVLSLHVGSYRWCEIIPDSSAIQQQLPLSMVKVLRYSHPICGEHHKNVQRCVFSS